MYTNFTIFDACYYKNENMPYRSDVAHSLPKHFIFLLSLVATRLIFYLNHAKPFITFSIDRRWHYHLRLQPHNCRIQRSTQQQTRWRPSTTYLIIKSFSSQHYCQQPCSNVPYSTSKNAYHLQRCLEWAPTLSTKSRWLRLPLGSSSPSTYSSPVC